MNQRNEQNSHGGKSSFLPHHFDSARQHYDSNILGIWIFLATEIMMFGGLFCGYAVYRARHPEIFVYADRFLDKNLGCLNTIILLTSSLTMAWAVRNAQRGNRRGLILCLTLTLLFGSCFMGVKFIEYQQKWRHGLLWGQKFHPHGEPGIGKDVELSPATDGLATRATSTSSSTASDTAFPTPAQGPSGLASQHPVSDEPSQRPRNVHIFFGIYFAMTGLHGLHILIGMGLILWLIIASIHGRFSAEYFIPVDQVGLYWHLVDVIWIFLFPLLYLIH